MNGFIFTLPAVICIAALLLFAPADSSIVCFDLGVLRATALLTDTSSAGLPTTGARGSSAKPSSPAMLHLSNMSAQHFH